MSLFIKKSDSTIREYPIDSINFVHAREEYEANLFALYLLSHSYDVDPRLLEAAPRNKDLMTYREAHELLCRCVTV